MRGGGSQKGSRMIVERLRDVSVPITPEPKSSGMLSHSISKAVLHNVWCPHCSDMTTMTDFTRRRYHGRNLVLFGQCVTLSWKGCTCARGHILCVTIYRPGDKVIWWKRIPGGDYVYPVQATVLALTAKRVKIAADDDGDIVVGYLPQRKTPKRCMRSQGLEGDVSRARRDRVGAPGRSW